MGINENYGPKRISQLPGFQGNLYQQKLLMLYLQRGLKKNLNFELATEVEEAHKFDDIVFRYKKDVDVKFKYVILQSKHKTTENPKITYQDIFTDANGDFGLLKYFNAFKKAKNERLFRDGEIEHAIIYTNAKIDMFGEIPEKNENLGKLKNINNITSRIKVDQNEGLSFCKNNIGKYYRLKIDLVLPVIKRLFSVYYMIAQKLIEALTNDKKRLAADDGILKDFDCLLVTEVIDINNRTLRKEFIDEVGNVTGRQKLRNAMNEVAKQKGIDLDNIIWNKLTIRNNFGKQEKQQNWPDDIVDADVEEFLKKFVLATEQPNEYTLGEILLSELGDQYTAYDADMIFSHLAFKIQTWMTGGDFVHNTSEGTPKYRFISTRDAEIFFKTTTAKLNKNMLKVPTTKYESYFEKNDIEFDDNDIQDGVEVLLSSDTRILSIFSEHIIISSIKLYKELKHVNELGEYIYVRLSSLTTNIIDAFEIESTYHLIVIELDLENTKGDDWMENIIEIYDIIKRNDKKRLITLSNQNNELKNILPADLKIVEINDNKNTLKNLTEVSQKHFLETDIKFQGCSVKLNDLIVDDDLKTLINGKILLEILENKNVEIGQELEKFEDGINYYIERTFTCEIKRNENMYLICGINENDFYSINKNIHIIEKPEPITDNESNMFECALKENESMSIYLLRKTGDELILLKKSKAAFEKSNVSDDIHSEREMRLISAVAGMGKSSMFTYLSKKFKEHNPTFWVIKINLNEVSPELNKMKVEDIKCNDAINFLSHGSSDKAIFESYLRTGRVMLYLDAFDEVSDENKKIVLKIIQKLWENTKISKIWMNTRPNNSILQELKKLINDIPLKHLNIEPFTREDQKKYLLNSWKELNEFNKKRFETFAEELLKFLNKTFNDRQYEFLGVALHTKMISVALKDRFENSLMSDSSTIIDEQQFKLSTLYKKFVEEKFKIYWEDKSKNNSETKSAVNLYKNKYNDFVSQCKVLALDSLFDKEQLNIFLSEEDIGKLEEYKKEMKDNGDEHGIVNKIVRNKPHFVHRTFAEYFTADFLLNVLIKEDAQSLNTIEYFLKNMMNHENHIVYYLINDMLNDENLKQNNNHQKIIKELSGKVLNNAIINNWQNIAIWLLENGINMDYTDSDGNVLHSTSFLQNSNKLMEKMLKKLRTENKLILLVNAKNSSDGNTPLYVAVRNGRLDNIECLLKTYKEEKVLDRAFTDENKRGENIFHLSAYKTCDYDTFIYLWKYASRENPEKMRECFIKTDQKGDTPLKVAAAAGQLKKLKAVLESDVDSEIKDSVFDNENRFDQNIFHLIADKNHDDDTFVYLFSLASNNSVKLQTYFIKTDYKGNTPLKVAAADGQLKKLKAVLESNVDSKIKDSVFDNENSENQNIFHLVASNGCDDGTFIYLLNLASKNPEKLQNYFIKTDYNGDTPLKVAARYGQLEKLKAVLKYNADSKIEDSVFDDENSENQNIFHLVASNGCDDDTFIYLFNLAKRNPEKLQKYFIKKDNRYDTPLKVAARCGQLNKLKAVLDLEPNVDQKIKDSVFDDENRFDQNIFHLVACNGCDDETFIYLFNLASKNPEKLQKYFIKKDYNGDTPLKVAARHGQLKKLKAVLESNVDSKINDSVFGNENSEGQNIFHLVAKGDCDYHTFIYLFDLASYNPVTLKRYFDKTDHKGDTPLVILAKLNRFDKLKTLLYSKYGSEIVDAIFQEL